MSLDYTIPKHTSRKRRTILLPAKLRDELRPLLACLLSVGPPEESWKFKTAILKLLHEHELSSSHLVEYALADKAHTPGDPPVSEPDWSGEMSDWELHEVLDFIQEHHARLNEKTLGFIESLEERANEYENVLLSDKQMQWLKVIYREAKAWWEQADENRRFGVRDQSVA